jgi:hypothetical protein
MKSPEGQKSKKESALKTSLNSKEVGVVLLLCGGAISTISLGLAGNLGVFLCLLAGCVFAHATKNKDQRTLFLSPWLLTFAPIAIAILAGGSIGSEHEEFYAALMLAGFYGSPAVLLEGCKKMCEFEQVRKKLEKGQIASAGTAMVCFINWDYIVLTALTLQGATILWSAVDWFRQLQAKRAAGPDDGLSL